MKSTLTKATDVAPSKKQYPSLKAWREAMNLRQTEAAALLQTTAPTYCRWEHGQLSPRREKLHRIARITGVPLLTLLRVA